MARKKIQRIVTREGIINLVNTADHEFIRQYVSKAILVIYNRQTHEEQEAGQTVEHNGVGFTGPDAEWGTRCAKWMKEKNRLLTDKMLVSWIKLDARGAPRIAKYHRQLDELARQKAAQ